MLQNRFKSKVLWIGIGTQILAVLFQLDIIDVGTSEVLKNILISLCELFVTFGILNNPTSSDSM